MKLTSKGLKLLKEDNTEKFKLQRNPELTKGDRIIVISMDGETDSVPMMSAGVVDGINNTPFGLQYKVSWDNGSKLDLIPEIDIYYLEDDYLKAKELRKKSVNESDSMEWFVDNKDLKKFFDLKKILSYLELIRKSGITNMWGAGPLIYIGGEMLDRLNPYPPDEESFREAVEMADDVKDELIRGIIKFMESKGQEIELEVVKRHAQKFAQKLLEYWMRYKSL